MSCRLRPNRRHGNQGRGEKPCGEANPAADRSYGQSQQTHRPTTPRIRHDRQEVLSRFTVETGNVDGVLMSTTGVTGHPTVKIP